MLPTIMSGALNSRKEGKLEKDLGEIVIYQTDDGLTKIDVNMQDETVWLTQEQMAELFQRDKSTISRHIKNIFTEGELNEKVVVAEFTTTTQHGAIEGKTQSKITKFYNLDVIISVGYRVKSQRGTQFRIWATSVLKEYMIKGFAMDDDRLKGNGGGQYWKELLNRIRDIRSSEKVMYRQVLDLYATSADYDPKSQESKTFFSIVQNKLHYATHGSTAAEVIFNRADATKPFMGLTTFKGQIPVRDDISVAKNYLKEDELKILNNLVSAYFDIAEVNAINHHVMYMTDYIEQLDNVMKSANREILTNNGSISHAQAMKKANEEYLKYQENTLSPVEEEYLNVINSTAKIAKKKNRETKDK